jgi:hypothetical protein
MFGSRRLIVKVSIFYILTVLLILFGWTLGGLHLITSNIINDKKDTLYNCARQIAVEFAEYDSDNVKEPDLTSRFNTVINYMPVRIITAENDGIVIYDTEGSSNPSLYDFNTDILSQTFSVNVTLPGYIDEPFISVSYPVNSNMTAMGYIIVIYYMDEINESANTLNTSLWPYICLLILTVTALYIFVYMSIIIPLNKILKTARKLSNHEYLPEYIIKSHDEFRGIYDAIMYMGKDLSNLEAYQKEFIANVSHDFRSPLTSIKGYTDAMLDGTIEPDSYNKYLEIIRFEAERLTKLTTNLLTLESFDNRGMSLYPVEFDINKVIKQTAASFEGICTKKHITIRLIFDIPEIYVYADKDKIEQVLYNLSDNAIKFSPNNSSIYIETYIKGDKVFISVKDNGIGIPKESLSKIWDRFYKTDLSRGKDKKGTGLGLSIVKEIISAHDEHINVISTPGIGSEFSFSLPVQSV